MKCFNEDLQFKDLLINSKEITKSLTLEEIEECFNVDFFLRNVDNIYIRVGIK